MAAVTYNALEREEDATNCNFEARRLAAEEEAPEPFVTAALLLLDLHMPGEACALLEGVDRSLPRQLVWPGIICSQLFRVAQQKLRKQHRQTGWPINAEIMPNRRCSKQHEVACRSKNNASKGVEENVRAMAAGPWQLCLARAALLDGVTATAYGHLMDCLSFDATDPRAFELMAGHNHSTGMNYPPPPPSPPFPPPLTSPITSQSHSTLMYRSLDPAAPLT